MRRCARINPIKTYDTTNVLKKKPQTKCSTCTNTKKSSSHKKVLHGVKSGKTDLQIRGQKIKLYKTLSCEQQNTRDIVSACTSGVFDKIPILAAILNNFTSCLQERKFSKYFNSCSQDIIFPYTKNMIYSRWICYGNQSLPQFDSSVAKENCNSTILRRKISYGKLYKISRRNLNNQHSNRENLNRRIAQYRSSKNKTVLCKRCHPKPKKIPFWKKWYNALFGEKKETNQTEECETQCSCLNITKSKSKDALDNTKMKTEKCMDFESKPLCKKICFTNTDSPKKPCDDSELLTCKNILRNRKKEQSNSKVKKCSSKCEIKPCSSSVSTRSSSRNLATKSSTDCNQRKLMKERKSSNSDLSDCKTVCSKSLQTKSEDHLLLTCKNLREMLGYGIPCVDKIPNKCDEHKICKTNNHKENKNDDNDCGIEEEECKPKPQRFQCKGKLGDYDDAGLLSCRNIKKTEHLPCIQQSYSSFISQKPKTPLDKPIPCINKNKDESDPIPCIRQKLDHPPCMNKNKNRRCVPCNRPQRTNEHNSKCRRCVPCKPSQLTNKYKRCVSCKKSNPNLYSFKQELMSNITESSASSAFKLMMSDIKNKRNCALNETILLKLPKEFKMCSAESPENSINKCAEICNNNNFNGKTEIVSRSINGQYPFCRSDSENFRIDPTNQYTISKEVSQAMNKRMIENITVTDVEVKRGLSPKGYDCIKLKLQLDFDVNKNGQKNRNNKRT